VTRELPEWIGGSDDARVPGRVRLRVFERHEGRCHISGRKIMPGDLWDLDHIVALVNGGKHRESNLAPALRDKHRAKTAEDVAEKSTVRRKRSKHVGIRKAKSPMRGWKKFDGTPVRNPRAV
jgi:5-methylcytosine-specific restriction protein A